MDAKHFDAWTRRKFGLAAGSILAALLALDHTDGAGARRRCLRKGRVCSNTNKRCCKLSCDSTFANGEFGEFCCKLDDASCKPGASEPGCCSTYCDAETETCRTCQGRPCDANRPCCPQWNCEDDFCGGCAIEGAGCHDHRPCCPGNGNCTNGYCGGCIRSLSLKALPSASVAAFPAATQLARSIRLVANRAFASPSRAVPAPAIWTAARASTTTPINAPMRASPESVPSEPVRRPKTTH